ncbi:MAG TPA: hypothetical protein VGS14_11875 [Actinomycetes bacterium]|jgi:hypothetical protein|nr:hypothetical protein [Actinomycetes bacterium]
MLLRKSKAGKAKETVTEQVADRTDDLMAALEAAKEALARASTAAGRKGAELGKEASKAADKLLPERARQRRRESARRRRRRLLAGAAGLIGAGLVASRLAGSKGEELRQGLKRRADKAGGGWEPRAEPGNNADAASTAEVTQLHQGNGATTNPARTPPS